MSNETNSRRYRFYLAFNNISLGMVFILPISIAIISAMKNSPYGCDQTNTFLTWLLIIAMIFVNIKQTLEIFERNNMLEEDEDES